MTARTLAFGFETSKVSKNNKLLRTFLSRKMFFFLIQMLLIENRHPKISENYGGYFLTLIT